MNAARNRRGWVTRSALMMGHTENYDFGGQITLQMSGVNAPPYRVMVAVSCVDGPAKLRPLYITRYYSSLTKARRDYAYLRDIVPRLVAAVALGFELQPEPYQLPSMSEGGFTSLDWPMVAFLKGRR